MSRETIAAAVQRVEAALLKRPGAGRHDDAPARVCWEGSLRIRARHPSGTDVLTDMPPEIGGGGEGPSPGWLMRAGLASCTATCIALAAAAQGIELATLEVEALSRSDLRGMLGVPETDGSPVFAGPGEVQLRVRIGAIGVPEGQLRALVDGVAGRAPVTAALTAAVPVAVSVEVVPA